jgi:hypothetical protein
MPDRHKVDSPARRDHDAGEPAVLGDGGKPGVSPPVSAGLKQAEAPVAGRLQAVDHARLRLTAVRTLSTEGGEYPERGKLSKMDGASQPRCLSFPSSAF